MERQIKLLCLAIRWTSLGLVNVRRKVLVGLYSATSKAWWRGIMVWGCFSETGLSPLVPLKIIVNASTHQVILDNHMGAYLGWLLPVPTSLHTSAPRKANKDMDELVWCGILTTTQ